MLVVGDLEKYLAVIRIVLNSIVLELEFLTNDPVYECIVSLKPFSPWFT